MTIKEQSYSNVAIVKDTRKIDEIVRQATQMQDTTEHTKKEWKQSKQQERKRKERWSQEHYCWRAEWSLSHRTHDVSL